MPIHSYEMISSVIKCPGVDLKGRALLPGSSSLLGTGGPSAAKAKAKGPLAEQRLDVGEATDRELKPPSAWQ